MSASPSLLPASGQQVLPLPADSFVGRDRELADVLALITEYRLVTLTGPGGVGKTRLALAVAAHRVWTGAGQEAVFVDASPLAEAGLLPDRIARALGLRPPAHVPVLEAVARAAAGRSLLVVLDNLEHLDDAATVVGSLVGLDPRLHLLATSRRPLHVRGERVYQVPTLALPRQEAAPGEHEAASVVLFAQRAVAAAPGFQLTDDTRAVVGEICGRLDGLPLAIELAADWMRVLTPGDLLARLNRRLDLLDAAGGDRPVRHQALRTTIEWSYRLLDEPTRTAFRAMAVFRGGWDLAGAAYVCEQPDEIVVLRQLAALTDASLIEPAHAVAGHARYRMLESLREFALDELTRCGEANARRDRIADYVHQGAADSAPQLTGSQQAVYLDRLEADRDTISAVLRWLAETGQWGRGLGTAALLWRFWHLRGHLQQGRDLLQELLAGHDATSDPLIRADAFTALAGVAYWQLDFAAAQQYYDSALTLYTGAGSGTGVAASHYNMAFTALFAADTEGARAYFGRALAEYEGLGDILGRANAVAGLALVDRATGDLPSALERITEALTQQRAAGSEFDAVNSLGLLGSIQARLGQVGPAQSALREAMAAHQSAGNVSGIAWMLHELAALAADGGTFERALRLTAAAACLEGDLGGGANMDILRLPELESRARAQLAPDVADKAWLTGQAMSLPEAVADASCDDGAPGSDHTVELDTPSRLSAREGELLTLVARGLTDAQIAQQLFISIRTVRSHLERIRDKTGCRRRADLTRLALEDHLL